MSNAVYPTLAGLQFDATRSPEWGTVTKVSQSGREYRATRFSAPLWRYTLSYEFLRSASAFTELQQLVGFFNQRQGSWDSWLFLDPDDNAVTAQAFGVGDATTTKFQLCRNLGGLVEPIYDVVGSPSIYVNGVLQTVTTNYSIGAFGIVTFVTAPGNTFVVSWTGQYYWRCRFAQDTVEFNKFMNNLWEAKKVEFVTIKP